MMTAAKTTGLTVLLILLVLLTCLWAPTRERCAKLCQGPSHTVGWFSPFKCSCRGDEFPLWERKRVRTNHLDVRGFGEW